MDVELVITEDGSNSLYHAAFDEHYHSVHGALQESRHVFIEAGFRPKIRTAVVLNILEIGFGTGLNALLTCIDAEKNKQEVCYHSIEKFPLQQELNSKLNYCSILQDPNCSNYLNAIHDAAWNSNVGISDQFMLTKWKMDICDADFSSQFDIIYFDAFAPSAQPELWADNIFASMYRALKNGGCLVTYCAKGAVKRTMKSAGFKVESLPGPKGKREMTRAVKCA